MTGMIITPDSLKEQLRQQRDLFHEAHATRLHRAISWWRAALAQEGQTDLQFITAWISLNACALTAQQNESPDFLPLMQRLVRLDQEQSLYGLLWHTYSGPVKALIKNPYVYGPFWEAQRAADSVSDWRSGFEKASVEALNCLSRKKVPELLSITLERLSVLQDQVLGGGATYASQVNREQVETGAKLLLSLLPVILNIMLHHPDEDWGELAYPVLKQPV
ncbi:MAG TPA: hypothetical protein DEA26_07480 [Oceanospirillales bacterium]|nr:hypothetical protein [Oceanospirillaceae bacterium]HBS42504.1 hypothetical protein [Oceanospirillales bacterium]